MCPLRVLLLWPLRVLVLWALLCPGTGNIPSIQEFITTQPGSDLLLPIRLHLTLNHTDTRRCDWIIWYMKSYGQSDEIAEHRNCDLSENKDFPNTRISENGSLIISNVTLENSGIMYSVDIYNSTGKLIQTDDYIVNVERNGIQEFVTTRPGSDLLLPIRLHLTLNHTDTRRCDRIIWYMKSYGQSDEIAEHRNCDLSENKDFPNTRISENGSLIISNVILENSGIMYSVDIYNSTGKLIQTDDYIVNVEGKGVQEEIFTRPGSDLLFPIRLNLTLSHPDRERCDWFSWYYEHSPELGEEIAIHVVCDLSESKLFPNTRISENGSLIISNVTLENDGIYRVATYRRGSLIQTDYYTVHVEGGGVQEEIFTRPGSDLLLPMRLPLTLNHPDTRRCDEFTWYYKESLKKWKRIADRWDCELYESRHFPNTRISVNGSLIISHVTLENDGRYGVEIYNSTGHRILTDLYTVHVEGESRSEKSSGWGHFLSSGAVFVLYTGLLIFMVNDLRKNQSERRTRRRDQVEMEMEPTYYDDCE
ncbi:uncharacterized protein LOC120921643 [Rana temporaria]|uniref:uncharacterized protein LOC120921643 n=1 Tax=Rana temporaria TaxID=8407 RepID=UPI001AAD690F|nr:uncharacterized protein LOC120921643 [Rana temporaria]